MKGHMSKQLKQELDSGLPRSARKTTKKKAKSGIWQFPVTPETPLVTQGHVKAAVRFQDLLLSPAFTAELAQITQIPDAAERLHLLLKLAEKHDLDLGEKSPLRQLARGEAPDLTNPDLDFCRILDRGSEICDSSRKEFYATRPFERHAIGLYPVHICISPLATKRDVLDYVTKRWGEIRWCLNLWGFDASGIRKRPKAERDQFIWERRDLPCSTIVKLLEVEYPGKFFDYAQVNAILKNLRKRYSGM
jgi:hypothetical protein